MKTKAFCSKVFANDCHGEIACTLTAKLFWQCESQPTGFVCTSTHLAQQCFPIGGGHAVVFKVGAGPFTTMIKESFVVVLRLQRLDFCIDECINLLECLLNLLRYGEVHTRTVRPNDAWLRAASQGDRD